MIIQYATPDTLEESQDQLLLAGSKLTFADIYNKQMDIPPVKGKYYRANDVDNTFILMNGVLTDISQQAFRKNKQMVELQEEVSELRSQITHLEQTVSSSSDLQEQRDALQSQLDKRENELRRLAILSKQKIESQEEEITRLNQENDQLGDTIELLVNRIKDLESRL